MYLSDNQKCPKMPKRAWISKLGKNEVKIGQNFISWELLAIESRLTLQNDHKTWFTIGVSRYMYPQTTGSSTKMPNWALFGIFGALPVVWEVHISENNYSKSSLMIILRGEPTLYGQRFSRYQFVTNFDLILAQFWDLSLFGIFGALPVVWEVHISENTYSKWSFVIILRGQPTFYRQRFSSYEFLTNFDPILAQFWDSGPFWHFWDTSGCLRSTYIWKHL